MNDDATATPETTKWPLDFDSLDKGMTISVDTLRQIFGFGPERTSYQFRCMALCAEIGRQLAHRGLAVTVCQTKHAIRILTDAEASAYNARQGRLGARRIRRAYRRALAVNIENLTETERLAHERRLLSLGQLNNGLKARRIPAPAAHRSLMKDTGLLDQKGSNDETHI